MTRSQHLRLIEEDAYGMLDKNIRGLVFTARSGGHQAQRRYQAHSRRRCRYLVRRRLRQWSLATSELARSCVCPSPWAAVYVLTLASGDESLTNFHHGLLSLEATWRRHLRQEPDAVIPHVRIRGGGYE